MSTNHQDRTMERHAAAAPEASDAERWERSDQSEAERADGAAASPRSGPIPDPEVPAKARRRRFTAEYKLDVLRQADACSRPGELGALLRREGLYSSHLTSWRKQRESGSRKGLTPKQRGRRPKPRDPVADENAKLQREVGRLQHRLKQAETIIDFQKKVSELLGIPLDQPPNDESSS